MYKGWDGRRAISLDAGPHYSAVGCQWGVFNTESGSQGLGFVALTLTCGCGPQ